MKNQLVDRQAREGSAGARERRARQQNSKNGSDEPNCDVLGLGNSCLDQILALDPFPQPGTSTPVLYSVTAPGGQVASALVAGSRLGLRTRFALRIGDDEAGEQQRAALEREGVDLSLARKRAGVPSARALILLDVARGQRAVVWNTDTRLAVAAAEVSREIVAQARLLYIDGKDGEACLAASRWARALGRPVVSDIDTPTPWSAELIGQVSDCICNREFLPAYTGIQELEPALRKLAGEGPRMVCATLGAEGALAWTEGRWHRAPGFSVNVVDDTGAGDGFRAGYVYALLAGWPIEARLAFANATAACVCETIGAVPSMPTMAQVRQMLARFHASGPWERAC